MIDIIETVYRGASKGRGLVVAPKGGWSMLFPLQRFPVPPFPHFPVSPFPRFPVSPCPRVHMRNIADPLLYRLLDSTQVLDPFRIDPFCIPCIYSTPYPILPGPELVAIRPLARFLRCLFPAPGLAFCTTARRTTYCIAFALVPHAHCSLLIESTPDKYAGYRGCTGHNRRKSRWRT
jgi:hypothetical protein